MTLTRNSTQKTHGCFWVLLSNRHWFLKKRRAIIDLLLTSFPRHGLCRENYSKGQLKTPVFVLLFVVITELPTLWYLYHKKDNIFFTMLLLCCISLPDQRIWFWTKNTSTFTKTLQHFLKPVSSVKASAVMVSTLELKLKRNAPSVMFWDHLCTTQTVCTSPCCSCY